MRITRGASRNSKTLVLHPVLSSCDRSHLLQHFLVEIHDIPDRHTCSFSLIGIDASITNAFRRILLAEIPTLAIEYVFVQNNTSIIQDEVLAQRLGLVPLKGGKEGLDWMKIWKNATDEDPVGSSPSDFNTVVLKLAVRCSLNEEAKKGETDPLKRYHNAHGKQMKLQPSERVSSSHSN